MQLEVGPPLSLMQECTVSCRVTDRAGGPSSRRWSTWWPSITCGATSGCGAGARGGGLYEATFRFTCDGLWEFRLVIATGRETFSYVEQRRV